MCETLGGYNRRVNECCDIECVEESDGLVVGSPVYYSSPNGTLIALLDRLFYSSHFSKHMKEL